MKTEVLMHFCQELCSIRYSSCLTRINQEKFPEMKSALTSPKLLEMKRPTEQSTRALPLRTVNGSISLLPGPIREEVVVSKSWRDSQRLKGISHMRLTIEPDLRDIYLYKFRNLIYKTHYNNNFQV